MKREMIDQLLSALAFEDRAKVGEITKAQLSSVFHKAMNMKLSDKQIGQLLTVCPFDKKHQTYVYIPLIE